MFQKIVTKFDENKIKDMYNELMFKFESATDERDQFEIYRELLGLKTATNIERGKIKALKPQGFSEYIKQKSEELTNYFIEFDDLTFELCKYWVGNLRALMHDYYVGNLKYQSLTKSELFDSVNNFFISLTFLDKSINNLFCDFLNSSNMEIVESILKERAEAVYFLSLQEVLVKIKYNRSLSDRVRLTIIHELGHVYTINKLYKKNISSKEREKSILTESIPSYFELEGSNFISHNSNNRRVSELLNQYLESGVLNLADYYASGNEKTYENYENYLGIIASMYGDIIALQLREKKRENPIEFQKDFAFLSENIYSDNPFNTLKAIGIDSNTMIKTAKKAKQLILSK